jgi:hypothetical protein
MTNRECAERVNKAFSILMTARKLAIESFSARALILTPEYKALSDAATELACAAGYLEGMYLTKDASLRPLPRCIRLGTVYTLCDKNHFDAMVRVDNAHPTCKTCIEVFESTHKAHRVPVGVPCSVVASESTPPDERDMPAYKYASEYGA